MKGSRLHLDLFKVFRDLADTKSFSNAAALNFLTQSAVSQQVSFLERHLGRKLIDRGKGRFALTDAGNTLLEGSRRVLAAYQDTAEAIRNPGAVCGSIKLETVYSIGLHGLARHVKTFMHRFPMVDLKVEYNRSDRIYASVLQGACDLGIVAYPAQHPLLRIRPFQREKLVVVGSPDDELVRKRRVRLAQLQGKDFVAFSRDIPTRTAIDGLLRRYKVLVNVVHEFDNIETIKRSVEIGGGVSILPDVTVAREVAAKTWDPLESTCRHASLSIL